MKFIAFLRGINVGGNSLIKMADLKSAFEKLGFTNILTYINSGNVIFDSNLTDQSKIAQHLESGLSKQFNLDLRVVVVSKSELDQIIKEAPTDWKKRTDIRCYLTFVRPPATPSQVLKEVNPKEDIDFIKEGPGVVYMTTLLSGITKSGFSKLAAKPIYQDITIRNYNTAIKIQKILVNSP